MCVVIILDFQAPLFLRLCKMLVPGNGLRNKTLGYRYKATVLYASTKSSKSWNSVVILSTCCQAIVIVVDMHARMIQKVFGNVGILVYLPHGCLSNRNEEQTSKMLHLEHSFVWCWNLNDSGSRWETLGKFLNVVLKKDGEDQLDRSCEKWRSVT